MHQEVIEVSDDEVEPSEASTAQFWQVHVSSVTDMSAGTQTTKSKVIHLKSPAPQIQRSSIKSQDSETECDDGQIKVYVSSVTDDGNGGTKISSSKVIHLKSPAPQIQRSSMKSQDSDTESDDGENGQQENYRYIPKDYEGFKGSDLLFPPPDLSMQRFTNKINQMLDKEIDDLEHDLSKLRFQMNHVSTSRKEVCHNLYQINKSMRTLYEAIHKIQIVYDEQFVLRSEATW